VYVPADRAEALLMQRSVRENIALPFSAKLGSWGPINLGAERKKVEGGIEALQIDTRAASEVRRLSGGNQQKVTIARWVAGGVRTMLCFDPTRGIDIRTKHQIYRLLRDLADAGAAVLFYTSELKEIQLVCDRAIVICGGRGVAEIDAADADEPALLRAAYDLPPDPPAGGGGRVRGSGGRALVSAATSAADSVMTRADVLGAWARRNLWALGLLAFLAALLVFTKLIQPNYGVAGVQGLAISVVPRARAAAAHAIGVLCGGSDH
jgi:energy-coupling factor transporter ATP-binding protein EcfA2